ncbi:MAG: hypothetical protein HC812_11540 [Leptolyngbya sp. RL_3_1]|nr:hypothetical protein [Leptolyngbya sp. RL_3_1]
MALSATALLVLSAIAPAAARQSPQASPISALQLAAPQLATPQITPSPVVEATLLLAQANANSILYFRTGNYTVHVFQDGGQNRMNVYNNTTGVLQQSRAITDLRREPGFTIFFSRGFRNGFPATYRAVISSSNRLSFQIFDSAGRLIVEESAVGDVLVNVAPGDLPLSAAATEDILAFDTTTYAARVFRRSGNPQYFMNVHNKVSGQTEQSGVLTVPSVPVPPYERHVSYVSSGTYNNIPAQYFMRINDRGQTSLEIISQTGQRLFQEPGVGPVTLNIPQRDIPAGVDRIDAVTTAYVVAVFGQGNTLSQVQQLYPEAVMENSGLGRFINAGEFADRDLAMARVLELRGRGFNSRLVYRDVRYR